MRRNRDHVGAQPGHVNSHPAHRLRGVAVKQRTLFVGGGRQFGDRLHDTDLVVGLHHRYQHSVVAQRRSQLIHADHALLVHAQCRKLQEPFVLESAAGIEHGPVFGRHGDHVAPTLTQKGQGAFYGEVVGLGGAAGKQYLARLGADKIGHSFPGGFNQRIGLPAQAVTATGRVAVDPAERGQHFFEHARVHLRGGLVIQVNSPVASGGHSVTGRGPRIMKILRTSAGYSRHYCMAGGPPQAKLQPTPAWARHLPVYDSEQATTCSGVPATTTRPPPSPPSGPMSMT